MSQIVGFPFDGNVSASMLGDSLIPAIENYVVQIDNDGNPFLSWFANPANAGLIKEDQLEYFWNEDIGDIPTIKILTAIVDKPANTPQDITIDYPVAQTLQTLKHVESNQMFLVVAVGQPVYETSVQVTIRPFDPSEPTIALDVNTEMKNLGVTMPTGGFYSAPVSQTPKRLSNIMGRRTYSVGIERSTIGSPVWYDNGDSFSYSMKQRIKQSKGDCERTYLFSDYKKTTYTQQNPLIAGSQYSGELSATDGVWNRITTNVDLYSGTATEFKWDSFLKLMFGQLNHGYNRKMFLMGSDTMFDINQFAKNKYRIVPPEGNFRGTYGMDVEAYSFFAGCGGLLFMERELLTPTGSTSPLTHTAIALDTPFISIRHKRDSFIEIHPDSQQNNQDVTQTSWVFEDGVALKAEQFHGRFSWT